MHHSDKSLRVIIHDIFIFTVSKQANW